MIGDDVERAGRVVRLAVHAVAREAAGFRGERSLPGRIDARRDVEPLVGVRAAVLARDVAAGCVREFAVAARGEGRSWDTVAAALDLGPTDPNRGERAYWYVVDDRPLHPRDVTQHAGSLPVARWRCSCCGCCVTGHGPLGADPASVEHGHGSSCVRHIAGGYCPERAVDYLPELHLRYGSRH